MTASQFKMKRYYLCAAFLLFLFFPHIAFAQGDNIINSPLALLVLLGAISLAPFVLIMVTSFVKISVVLSILRQALGTQQIPPTQVINGLAIILTIYIMYPVALEIKDGTAALFDERSQSPLLSDSTTRLVKEGVQVAKEPLRKFMLKHAHIKDRQLFYGLARRMRTPEQQKNLSDKALIVVVPAFVISELKEAFQIGFLIFVPFIVIDMVVSNILMSMGMMMLSPTTISLPFKILLFILIDGWYLIARGLVLGYIPH
ncbi:type III secretion system export apparatus subunit SctR [bacterium]|nr:type III secretion system export apparatus subunit SctR [bacterium]